MHDSLHLPNVDSISSLIDRLIVEHIKRFEPIRACNSPAIATQVAVTEQLRYRLAAAFRTSMENHNYNVLPEVRDMLLGKMVSSLESLVMSNALLGFVEREKIAEVLAIGPTTDLLVILVAVARLTNERRARDKQCIDEALSLMLNTPRQ
jgi:hypothetical protein